MNYMFLRLVAILTIMSLTACRNGLIPCPTVKSDKMKKTVINKRLRYAERNTTASIEPVNNQPSNRTRPLHNYRAEIKPTLEHMNVEEWDCPKPGMKRNVPKTLKDNIKKNRKAYEDYYKNRYEHDSLAAAKAH